MDQTEADQVSPSPCPCPSSPLTLCTSIFDPSSSSTQHVPCSERSLRCVCAWRRLPATSCSSAPPPFPPSCSQISQGFQRSWQASPRLRLASSGSCSPQSALSAHRIAKKNLDSEKFTSNRLLCLSLLRASFRASLPPFFAPLKLPPLFPPCCPRCRLPPRPFADDRLNLFNDNI